MIVTLSCTNSKLELKFALSPIQNIQITHIYLKLKYIYPHLQFFKERVHFGHFKSLKIHIIVLKFQTMEQVQALEA